MRTKNNGIYHQYVKFYRENNPMGYHMGILLQEDYESCTIGFDVDGTEATIVCYYDEWIIEKIGE